MGLFWAPFCVQELKCAPKWDPICVQQLECVKVKSEVPNSQERPFQYFFQRPGVLREHKKELLSVLSCA